MIRDFFNPVPFTRSITFWAGLLVLVFLLAAWIDSRSKLTFLSTAKLGGFSCVVSNENSVLKVYYLRQFRLPSGAPTRLGAGREDIPAVYGPSLHGAGTWHSPWFPQAVRSETMSDVGEIALAHWFLILLHLGLWGGLIYYRHRRIRRARAATATLPVADEG